MSINIHLIISFLIIICGLSASFDIECEYKIDNFYKFGDPYFCKAISLPNITTYESAQITSIAGTHSDLKSNDDVTGFYSVYKILQYFPRNLEKFFTNLELIFIEFAELKEIHQADLKPFPKLIYLSLCYNSIEVLESGVFDANPNLEILSFVANNLVHIEPDVFDNLPKLRCFWFSRTCVKKFVYNRDEVIEAIDVARNKCVNADYVFMNEKLTKLETESKFLNSEEFTENYEKFGKSFEKSRFFNFTTLRNRFEGLRNYTVDLGSKPLCRNPASLTSLTYDFEAINTTIDMKILHLSENMKELVSEGLGLNDKLTKIDGKFSKFEAKMSKKLSKIDKEVETTKSRIDAKLKKIENNFLEKFGEIVEEKLRKILDEKLDELLSAKIQD
ncbi:uncharacterized protein [Chironomus tepperi]|uniref:uncharacterized protein n=1 Tax=Chironomus tepperi TaxID=113505 RepID=UPI00391F8A84